MNGDGSPMMAIKRVMAQGCLWWELWLGVVQRQGLSEEVMFEQGPEDEEVLALGLSGDRAQQAGGVAGAKALR